jgi:hypothetical protein
VPDNEKIEKVPAFAMTDTRMHIMKHARRSSAPA